MNQTVEKRLDGASVGDWIRNNTNLLLMFALIVVGALTSDNFFSMDNILNVLRRITVNGMLAVACTMTLLVGGFDLSIGHVMALSAVLCIGFEKSTGSGAVGIVVALAAGLVLGLINGLLMKLTRGGSGEGVPTVEITKEDGNDILSLLVKSGLCASKSDARRNVQQGGVTANDSKVTDIAKTFTEAELRDGVVLKRGKKNFRKMLLK